MATESYEQVNTYFDFGPSVTERLLKNESGSNISAYSPIVITGFDAVTENCLTIKKPSAVTDIVFGIILNDLENSSTRLSKYVVQGPLFGINTSAWNVNDLLYAKTDGSLTNDATADAANTIPQEIALVVRSHASAGELFVSSVGSQLKYVRMALTEIIGSFFIKNSDESKYIKLLHDGTDGIIETSSGELKTNNKILNTGTEIIKTAGAIMTGLVASKLVETDSAKKLVSRETALSVPLGGTGATGFTGDKVVVSNSGGTALTSFGTLTLDELGYLIGVTSGIQGQLDALEGRIAALEALGGTTNNISFVDADGYDITINVTEGRTQLLSKT